MRADLHLHSRYSDRSAEWLFRRFDFPDSYSDPRALLLALRERGMDFFTLTDHNRIDGCLEMRDIAATADGDEAAARVFLSEEVTAYFPDDRCKVHLLVWGLNETQHREIDALRENIFDLQRYLAAQNLTPAVAHPLFSVNQKLGAPHIEKLILLFRHFETINGLRDDLFNAVARHLFASLTPEKIATFANRHDLAPTHAEPWKKVFTAGSDDHGGLFPAHAWTETPAAKNTAEFLAHLSAGHTTPRGQGGTPLALSHGLYNTAYAFAKDRLLKPGGMLRKGTPPLLEKMFSRFMEGENPTQFSFAEKLNFLADGVLSGRIFELMKPGNASLWKELADYFSQPEVKRAIARQTADVAEPERRAFLIANLFANQLAYRFFVKFVRQVSSGNMIEGLQAISAIAPLGLLLSPYIYSFRSQSPDRPWLRALSREVSGTVAPPLRNVRRAWFTDTLEDVNGVATTIRRMAATAKALGHDLTVVTSRSHVEQIGEEIPLKNFPPIGEFEIPEYELQKLTFPPMLEMIDYIQRERFTELIISTPGPVGITALLAAKALHLRVVGIYHTDFPQYVQILTDDHFMESLIWRFMYWFYHQLDGMYVNSEEYRRIWIDRGIEAEKIAILPRGLDTELFHPTRRAPGFWRERGAKPGEIVLLYVGRISKEKNLDVFAAAHDLLRGEGLPVRAALVGDGVYRAEMGRLLPDAIFTGTLAGKELARAYASADVFVFPSVSDTFGNVVIEAQASGLPVVVSDQKGPQELVEEGVTGCITRGLDAADLARALAALLRDAKLRATIGANARRAVEARSWAAACKRFWAMSPE